MLTVEWHVPFSKALVTAATDAFLVKHLLQVVVEVLVEHRAPVALVPVRRVDRELLPCSWLER